MAFYDRHTAARTISATKKELTKDPRTAATFVL